MIFCLYYFQPEHIPPALSMKRLYSTILLVSFCTGALQPIVPMAEYIFTQGELLQIVFMDHDNNYRSSGAFCTHDVSTLADDWNNSTGEQSPLIDMEYYPIPVQMSSVYSPELPPLSLRTYAPEHPQIHSIFYNPVTPPPRHS
jgi:hypothetical protein